MRRRDLIAFVGAASALASFAAAQQPKMPTIGVLVVGSPASERFWRLFQQDMRELVINLKTAKALGVCTENLNSDVVTIKSAKDRI